MRAKSHQQLPVQPTTLEEIHHQIARKALECGVENNERLRMDCTVVESNIHTPLDSTLLWDCVRVLTRLLKQAKTIVHVQFTNHNRRAKRRSIKIQNAKRMENRILPYRDLIAITEKTARSAAQALARLEGLDKPDKSTFTLMEKLRRYGTLTERVIQQARRRVLKGETVPNKEKIVSVFEPHTVSVSSVASTCRTS